MKSNRVYVAPPVIEDLGTGRSYYNFNVSESNKQDDPDSAPVLNFDYDQVIVTNPVSYGKIIEALTNGGYQADDLKAKVESDCKSLNIPIDQ